MNQMKFKYAAMMKIIRDGDIAYV